MDTVQDVIEVLDKVNDVMVSTNETARGCSVFSNHLKKLLSSLLIVCGGIISLV